MDPNPFVLVPALLALQFVVFGWRIAREIDLAEQARRTWLLLSDYINLMLMLAVVVTCVILPLRTGTLSALSRATIAAAYTFMCFTPLVIAGHYRLYSRLGRTVYKTRRDYPWISDWEAFILVIAVLATAGAAVTVATG